MELSTLELGESTDRDPLAIAGYLGGGPKFDKAIARFSAAYADQNELDHQRLADAVAAGDVQAMRGI
jgi:hypothetical protein